MPDDYMAGLTRRRPIKSGRRRWSRRWYEPVPDDVDVVHEGTEFRMDLPRDVSGEES